MNPLLRLVEEKIQEAIANGDFDDLPGQGQPIDLSEDPHVPVELRMAYRMLKRAGVPPEELLMRNELAALKSQLIADSSLSTDAKERLRKRILVLESEANVKLERFKRMYFGL